MQKIRKSHRGVFYNTLTLRCAHCLGQARPIGGLLVKEVQVDDEKVESVPEFCYLGDMLSTGSSCKLAAVTHCKSAWDKFCQLLSLLINCNLPLLTRGRVYTTCVRNVMLHAAKTWVMTLATLNITACGKLIVQLSA